MEEKCNTIIIKKTKHNLHLSFPREIIMFHPPHQFPSTVTKEKGELIPAKKHEIQLIKMSDLFN